MSFARLISTIKLLTWPAWRALHCAYISCKTLPLHCLQTYAR